MRPRLIASENRCRVLVMNSDAGGFNEAEAHRLGEPAKKDDALLASMPLQ